MFDWTISMTLAHRDDAVAQGRFHQVGVNVARVFFERSSFMPLTLSQHHSRFAAHANYASNRRQSDRIAHGHRNYIVPSWSRCRDDHGATPRAVTASVTFAIVVASIMQGLST